MYGVPQAGLTVPPVAGQLERGVRRHLTGTLTRRVVPDAPGKSSKRPLMSTGMTVGRSPVLPEDRISPSYTRSIFCVVRNAGSENIRTRSALSNSVVLPTALPTMPVVVCLVVVALMLEMLPSVETVPVVVDVPVGTWPKIG